MADLKLILWNPRGKAKGIFYFKRLTFCLTLFLIATMAEAQAKMEVKDSKLNYGFVKRGQIIKNEFEISNAGNEPLIISDAEVACSCTTVDYPKRPIMPGQKVIVTVNFNTTTVYGRQDRIVYLHSNDPKSPAKLRYKGVVMSK